MSETKVVNVREESCDVYIGRSTKYSLHFGNPFFIGQDGNREEVLKKFFQWLEGSDFNDIEPLRRRFVLDNIGKLKGKRLGCFCAPKACHGDIYKELLERGK